MLKPNAFIVPSAPVLRKEPPIGEHWIYEVKFDGWRLQLHKHGADVDLFSRKGNDLTSRFPFIADSVALLPCRSVIIDAEAVVCDEEGIPDFNRLMSHHRDEDLCAWCFDLLELNGKDLRLLPLIKRRQCLEVLLSSVKHSVLRYSCEFSDPITLLEAADRMGLEGIVCKRVDQRYVSGNNPGWVKVKTDAWRAANRDRWKRFEK